MKAYLKALGHAVGVRRFAVVSAVSAVVSFYGYLREWLQSEELWVPPDVPSWVLAVIAFFLFLVWWLLARIVELEREIEPRLEMEFRPEPPFVITEPMGASGRAVRIFRVKISNKSVQNLQNCLVKLESIERTDDPHSLNRFTPVGLVTQHQLLQERKGGPFDLRGREHKFVEVAFFDETKKKSEIGLLYEHPKYPNGIPRGSYELTIKAYGGGDPVEKKFRFSVDENNFFKVVLLGSDSNY